MQVKVKIHPVNVYDVEVNGKLFRGFKPSSHWNDLSQLVDDAGRKITIYDPDDKGPVTVAREPFETTVVLISETMLEKEPSLNSSQPAQNVLGETKTIPPEKLP